MDYLSLLHRIDDLYEQVVTHPAAWTDDELGTWVDDALGSQDGMTKEAARSVRRCVRSAQRLRDFWSGDGGSLDVDQEEWRTRVDVALGARAWRPTLELAQLGLEAQPSPELYAEVAGRFRVVHSEPWLEDAGYDEWLAGREPTNQAR